MDALFTREVQLLVRGSGKLFTQPNSKFGPENFPEIRFFSWSTTLELVAVDIQRYKSLRFRKAIRSRSMGVGAVSVLHHLEDLGGIGVHIESREFVAAHGPDMGEGS